MSNRKVFMSFAINDCGMVVSIEHADRGAACACFCPCCNEPVVAKQGDIKVWHFSHANGADCAGAGESALHLAAKQLLLARRQLVFPSLAVTREAINPNSRAIHVGYAAHPEKRVIFDQVYLEQPIGLIIPDLICDAPDDRYLVEIAVTHFVDEGKRALIKGLNYAAIEIAINIDLREHWAWETLEEEVINNTRNKSWLHYPKEEELGMEASAQAKALADAEIIPAPRLTLPAKVLPVRTKLSWRGIHVWITEYDFGLVAWSPYNPEINAILKRFGGKWQPKYRNWRLPLWVKAPLVEELAAT
jgi:competence protein CoiA